MFSNEVEDSLLDAEGSWHCGIVSTDTRLKYCIKVQNNAYNFPNLYIFSGLREVLWLCPWGILLGFCGGYCESTKAIAAG